MVFDEGVGYSVLELLVRWFPSQAEGATWLGMVEGGVWCAAVGWCYRVVLSVIRAFPIHRLFHIPGLLLAFSLPTTAAPFPCRGVPHLCS